MRLLLSGSLFGRMSFILFGAFLVSCSNRSTTGELLNASFATTSLPAIDLISPTQDAQVNTANPTLSWSKRAVPKYNLRIARDQALTDVVLSVDIKSESYTVQNSDLIGLSALPTDTYYWSVRVAGLTPDLQSKVGSFFLVAIPSGSGSAGSLYIDVNSTNPVQTGSKTAPYRRIQPAISAAEVMRSYDKSITFNIFVAKGTYNTEAITLSPGISLFGGYDPATWSRNLTTNVTTITNTFSSIIIGFSNITTADTNSTIVDGFNVTVGSTSTTYAFDLTGSSPKIRNNTVSGTSTGTWYTIFARNGSNPSILNNRLTGSSIGTAVIQVSSSSPTIQSNIIQAGGSFNSIGITLFGNSGSVPQMVSQNLIHGGTGSQSALGISFASGNIVTISNNTIGAAGGGSTYSSAVRTASSSDITLTNNIFFTISGTTRYAFQEVATAAGNPTAMNNNLFFDAPGGLYRKVTTSYFDQDCTNSSFDFGTATACSNGGIVNPTGGAGAGTGNRATNGGTAAVFAAGYSSANINTWAILGGGIADLDASGGWTSGDIGADLSNIGPQ
ncbi:MAG: hypothetical protein U1F27_02935 [Turneriella sp.]